MLTKLEIITPTTKQRLLFTTVTEDTELKYGCVAVMLKNGSENYFMGCGMPITPGSEREIRDAIESVIPTAVVCRPTGKHSFTAIP